MIVTTQSSDSLFYNEAIHDKNSPSLPFPSLPNHLSLNRQVALIILLVGVTGSHREEYGRHKYISRIHSYCQMQITCAHFNRNPGKVVLTGKVKNNFDFSRSSFVLDKLLQNEIFSLIFCYFIHSIPERGSNPRHLLLLTKAYETQ